MQRTTPRKISCRLLSPCWISVLEMHVTDITLGVYKQNLNAGQKSITSNGLLCRAITTTPFFGQV